MKASLQLVAQQKPAGLAETNAFPGNPPLSQPREALLARKVGNYACDRAVPVLSRAYFSLHGTDQLLGGLAVLPAVRRRSKNWPDLG